VQTYLPGKWVPILSIERRHHDPVQSVKQEFLRQGGEQAELECRGAGLVQGECPCSKCKDKYKWLLSTPVSISDIRRMVISVYSMPKNSILTRTSSLMGKRPHGSVVRRTFIDRESRTTPLVMNRLRVLANKERWEKWVELSKFDQWALQWLTRLHLLTGLAACLGLRVRKTYYHPPLNLAHLCSSAAFEWGASECTKLPHLR